MSGGARKKFLMTNFTIPNNVSCIKYSLKSVPGLADVGLLDGDGDDSPELHPDVWRGQEKV